MIDIQRLVDIIKAELTRQTEAEEMFCEHRSEKYLLVDGYLNVPALAEAIEKACKDD